mgnify:CR=1 FL=1
MPRLHSFNGVGKEHGGIANLIHRAINDMSIKPGHRARDELKNHLVCDKQIQFINIEFPVRHGIQSFQAVGDGFRSGAFSVIESGSHTNSDNRNKH